MKVTLQLTCDDCDAKFVLALVSALTLDLEGLPLFGANLVYDDLPGALLYLSDKLGEAKLLNNLNWTDGERKFMKRFISESPVEE